MLYLARAADAAFAANDIGALWPQLVQSVMISEALLHSTGMALVLLAMTRERAELRSTHSLIAARDAAVAASEARSRFLASISHEVRTPLNAVIGLAQVLAEDEGFTSKQREQVETLEQAGRHLLSLVNDVLDLAKIDAGKFDLESRPFAVQSLATGCLSLLRATADARRISLELDIDPDVPRAVEGDETRMRQVLLNLLSNAVKFSPSDGRVVVRVQTRLGVLRLEIIDNGPGVPREKRDMLFQDYVQLDPVAAHRLGGSGLGLAISAALVRAMGGRIGWEAGPGGEGSVFWVEVPVRRSATEPPGLAAEGIRVTAPPVRAGRILVVDDMPSNRFLMSAMLERAGHSVQLASRRRRGNRVAHAERSRPRPDGCADAGDERLRSGPPYSINGRTNCPGAHPGSHSRRPAGEDSGLPRRRNERVHQQARRAHDIAGRDRSTSRRPGDLSCRDE